MPRPNKKSLETALDLMEAEGDATIKKTSSSKPITELIKEIDPANADLKFKLFGARIHPDVHRHLKSILGLQGMSQQEFHCQYYTEFLKGHGVEQTTIDLLRLPVPGSK